MAADLRSQSEPDASAHLPAGHGADHDDDGAPLTRPRTVTNTAEIDSTIGHPGSVRINVKGAFIVDSASATPANGRASPEHHQTKDIRLPNHHAVVSHIAIDVRPLYTRFALTL